MSSSIARRGSSIGGSTPETSSRTGSIPMATESPPPTPNRYPTTDRSTSAIGRWRSSRFRGTRRDRSASWIRRRGCSTAATSSTSTATSTSCSTTAIWTITSNRWLGCRNCAIRAPSRCWRRATTNRSRETTCRSSTTYRQVCEIAAGERDYEIVETDWGTARSYRVGPSTVLTKTASR